MGDYYTVGFFVWSGLVFALGYGTGQLFAFQRKRPGGQSVRLVLNPAVEQRWEAIKGMAAVMAGVMFVSVMYYALDFTWDQRQCNARLVDTQNYRADLANSDRALGDAKDAALLAMVRELLDPTTPGTGRDALSRYEERVVVIDAARSDNDEERRKNPLKSCDGGSDG